MPQKLRRYLLSQLLQSCGEFQVCSLSGSRVLIKIEFECFFLTNHSHFCNQYKSHFVINRKKVTRSSFYLQRNREHCVASLRRGFRVFMDRKTPQSKTFSRAYFNLCYLFSYLFLFEISCGRTALFCARKNLGRQIFYVKRSQRVRDHKCQPPRYL